MNKGRVGEERRGKETDGCSLRADDIVEITVPSLLVPILPNMEVRRPSEGAVVSCDPIPIWAMVVARYQCYCQMSKYR
jgi:hypothetical protein